MDKHMVQFRITATEAVKNLFVEMHKRFLDEGGSDEAPAKNFVDFMNNDIDRQLASLHDMKKELEELET